MARDALNAEIARQRQDELRRRAERQQAGEQAQLAARVAALGAMRHAPAELASRGRGYRRWVVKLRLRGWAVKLRA